MKRYFEFPFNDEVRKKLFSFYQNRQIGQHGKIQETKTNIKFERVCDMIDFRKDDMVLDIGCSSGFFLRKISPLIKFGNGLDISKDVILKNIYEDHPKNISYFEFDGKNIILENTFDKIFLLDVLEHAFEPDHLVKSIYDYLKPEGELIVEVPFTGWLSELVTKDYHEGHLRYYDTDYLKKYFKDRAFEIVSCKVYNSVPFSGFASKYINFWKIMNRIVNIIPPKIYPYFGEIVIVVKKRK